ncbi:MULTISPECIES: aminopeptidase P family protein [Ferrimicrobium]|uniref:aminopeptidase P family protein n=1 Tax=Ferrimicrobium TaxID=121038 RepID=UPI0023F06444|nr:MULTISPECIES: aminopeptidase P family protein [Ferrimicrobium]
MIERSQFEAAYLGRQQRTRRLLADSDIDVALISLGRELPWLIGYQAMPLERITCLYMDAKGTTRLIIPKLEAPRVRALPGLELVPWVDGEDPFELLGSMIRDSKVVAVDDRFMSGWLLPLMGRAPRVSFRSATAFLNPLRRQKDALEIEMLGLAASAADRVAERLIRGEIAVQNRREVEVAKDIGDALRQEGHSGVNFAIVGSGPNSASPHHEPSSRLIVPGDALVLDFGGTYSIDDEPGYCSDTTRTFVVGEIPEGFSELYEVLYRAQAAAREGIRVDMSGKEADLVARNVITEAGYGEYFVHRLGHGIGLDEHEDPYLSSDNLLPLEAGTAFSIEPGIYLPGRFGARIEDIVILEEAGVRALNQSPRELVVL